MTRRRSVLDGVRLLGDPFLRRGTDAVDDVHSPAFREAASRLHAALAAFRARHGFGRAMAAPQLGIAQRFIACNLGEGPFTIVNPRIVWRSPQRFTLWDDCISFPDLLVRVERHAGLSVEWTDGAGRGHVWDRLEPRISELLQHEVDHLDGVLAVDRALDRDSLVLRPVFEAQRAHFDAMVDTPAD